MAAVQQITSDSKRLAAADFEANEVRLRATTKRSGAHHVIWFATKPLPASR
jgi:hypothetical protein